MARTRSRRKPFDPAREALRREKALAAERAKLRADGIDVSVAEIDGVEVSRARQDELEAKGVTVVLNHRRRLVRAHKSDVWGELYSRGGLTTEQHAAVRHLQDLMAQRAGVAGRAEAKAYEDVQVECAGDACAVTDRMLEAAVRMDITMRLVGPPSSRILMALLWPVVMGEDRMAGKEMRRCQHVTPAAHVGAVQKRCNALNEVSAKRCARCGGEMAKDVTDDEGRVIARPGVETVEAPEDWRTAVARLSGEKDPHAQSALLRQAAQALVDVRKDVDAEMKRRADIRASIEPEPVKLRVYERPEPLFA